MEQAIAEERAEAAAEATAASHVRELQKQHEKQMEAAKAKHKKAAARRRPGNRGGKSRAGFAEAAEPPTQVLPAHRRHRAVCTSQTITALRKLP